MTRESFYDEIDIEDFVWDAKLSLYHYPCPCGDRFEITKSQLRDGDEVARCPSCSLIIRVIYEWVSLVMARLLWSGCVSSYTSNCALCRTIMRITRLRMRKLLGRLSRRKTRPLPDWKRT